MICAPRRWRPAARRRPLRPNRKLAALLEERGYPVALRPSPWLLGPEQALLQHALLTGWVAAVREIAPEPADELADWADQRRLLIKQGRTRLAVGHWDLFAAFTS